MDVEYRDNEKNAHTLFCKTCSKNMENAKTKEEFWIAAEALFFKMYRRDTVMK